MINKLLDKDYLRLPTKNKRPLRKDWSIPVSHYYKEPQTIQQLLKEHGEYGIRLGKLIFNGYHLCALIFRCPHEKKIAWLNYFSNLFSEVSYTSTENGLYYWLLIKELPPTCSLKFINQALLGELYSDGRIVIGAGSKIDDFIYQWKSRKVDYLIQESFLDLQNYLANKGVQLVIQGQTKLVERGTKELVVPSKLKARWKRRNSEKARRERVKIPKKERKLVKKRKKGIKRDLPNTVWKRCSVCQGRYKNKHFRCLTKCSQCQRRIREKKLVKHLKRFHE